jgi:hypothetical protein
MVTPPNDRTISDILNMHGYHDGSDQERLMLVFRDMARDRAVLAVYKLSIPPHMQPMIEMGIKNLVDS